MIRRKAREWDEIRARIAAQNEPPAPASPIIIPGGVTIRHSHGRYIASDGTRFGGWSETEKGALVKWQQLIDG